MRIGNRPVHGTRAGTLLKVVVLIAVIHLGFAGGIYYSNSLRKPTPPPPSPPVTNQIEQFGTDQEELENTLGTKLRRVQQGRWIADTPLTTSQFVELTGNSSRYPGPRDASVGYVTKAQAEAFCRMLSDAEHAIGSRRQY